jgi:rRNA maturation endonuclease Nob1
MAFNLVRQLLTRKLRCRHCGKRLSLFPPPTACPRCGRQIYDASDRRRRY